MWEHTHYQLFTDTNHLCGVPYKGMRGLKVALNHRIVYITRMQALYYQLYTMCVGSLWQCRGM